MAAPEVWAKFPSKVQPVRPLVVVPRNTAPPNWAALSSKMVFWMSPTPFCRPGALAQQLACSLEHRVWLRDLSWLSLLSWCKPSASSPQAGSHIGQACPGQGSSRRLLCRL